MQVFLISLKNYLSRCSKVFKILILFIACLFPKVSVDCAAANEPINIDKTNQKKLVQYCGGDARKMLNAFEIAHFLQSFSQISSIYYPGLKSHSHHIIAANQQLDPNGNSVFGGMISIDLGSLSAARNFVKKLNIFTLAESLGGVESLICHPATMTHASIPLEIRQELGVTDGLVRLSIGIEDLDDLKEDLEIALKS